MGFNTDNSRYGPKHVYNALFCFENILMEMAGTQNAARSGLVVAVGGFHRGMLGKDFEINETHQSALILYF